MISIQHVAHQPKHIQCNSSELGEELCPVSSFLPLRVHKLHIRVSFSDTFFLKWLSLSADKNFPFYTLLGSGCVLISYSMLSLILAWLGQDYSSEAVVADKETFLYCAVSPHRMFKFSYVDDTEHFRCKITCFMKKKNQQTIFNENN